MTVDYFGELGYSSMPLGPHTLEAGKYYLWVRTAASHSNTQLYSLTLTAITN